MDQFGANLASAPLPGRGHRTLHNQLQSLVKSMIRLAGISSEEEAANFLMDKVGDPHGSHDISTTYRRDPALAMLHMPSSQTYSMHTTSHLVDNVSMIVEQQPRVKPSLK